VKIFKLRRPVAADDGAAAAGGTGEPPVLDPAPRRLPDPSKPAQARGSWEQAALVNVGITELVKRQINAQTPPWKK
jgi:hypothetical protein